MIPIFLWSVVSYPVQPLPGLARLLDLVDEDLGYWTKRVIGGAHVA